MGHIPNRKQTIVFHFGWRQVPQKLDEDAKGIQNISGVYLKGLIFINESGYKFFETG